MATLQIKRVYDAPAATDGRRVLVDRLWPRGLSRERAAVDDWLKEVAPSTELRVWFSHEPAKFEEFSRRYAAELVRNPAVAQLADLLAGNGTITLLYGAKNPAVNHAVVLQKFLSHLRA